MSQSALHQGMAESLRESRDASVGSGESLLALTRDPILIETLTSVAPEHALHVVGSESDLMERLTLEPAGVAILDAAAASTALTDLTQSLRRQFPDLVLIVAGGPTDQSALSAQVTEGTVYRFLHKPVSAQRVKLFVDAAWKRHDVEHAATGSFAALKIEPVASEPTLPRNVLWAGGAVLVGVLTVTLWRTLATSSAPHTTPARVATPVSAAQSAALKTQQELTSLLKRADAALAAGTLVPPEHDNAAELYGAVLQRDPTNARARAGLSQVLDRLLTGAEQALLAEHLDEATRLTDAARVIQPDNVRVAFLVAQITKEQARSRAKPVAVAPTAAPEPRPAARGRNAAALAQARAALASGDLAEGERLLLAAADAGASPDELAPLQRQLQSLRIAAKANAMARYSDLFHQRLAQGQLLEPVGDSAKFYLEQLQASEPAHPTTVLARDALNARFLEEARKAIARPDLAAAENWIAQARTTGAPGADVAAAEQELTKARGGASASAIVAESQLKRVKYVAPVYPDIAERLGRRGVVELEFTVRADGAVTDLVVTHAEPSGVFENAATTAVRQWRYTPAARDGHPVSQRAKVRVVFAP